MTIESRFASITVEPFNMSRTKWEVDIRTVYVDAESPAEAIDILLKALQGNGADNADGGNLR